MSIKISKHLTQTPEQIYQAWSASGSITQWWFPQGFSSEILTFDFVENGNFWYRLTSADGFDIHTLISYQQLISNQKISYTHSFSDASKNITKSIFDEDWPLVFQNTFEIRRLGKYNTRVSLELAPKNPMSKEQQCFNAAKENLKMGIDDIFKRLEDYLNQQEEPS